MGWVDFKSPLFWLGLVCLGFAACDAPRFFEGGTSPALTQSHATLKGAAQGK